MNIKSIVNKTVKAVTSVPVTVAQTVMKVANLSAAPKPQPSPPSIDPDYSPYMIKTEKSEKIKAFESAIDKIVQKTEKAVINSVVQPIPVLIADKIVKKTIKKIKPTKW